MSLAVVILAAGEGTRMRSSYPKVLHRICGQPLLDYVVSEIRQLEPEKIVVVLGHQAEKVKAILDKDVSVVVQEEQKGTADAIRMTETEFADFQGTVMVTCGDIPLIRQETLEVLLGLHLETKAAATLLSAHFSDPTGYGRIIRKPNGLVQAIVEEKDATEAEKKISEINSGIYCFDKSDLFDSICEIGCRNAQNEFYLTDIVEVLNRKQKKIAVSVVEDSNEVAGVNSRKELAEAQHTMQARINEQIMEAGVTIIAPDLTFIGPEVEIGQDTVIQPFSFLEGKTRIGSECYLGPFVHLIDMVVGSGVTMENVVAEESEIEDQASLGPFSRIRPGTRIRKGAKVGSYVELKKSEVGEGSKVPHLSYMGDTIIGKDVNIGAGTITCNYDGVEKHKTRIEDGAFIGSDTMLVAPVNVGKNATTGAGSTIDKDVPAEGLALERTEQKIIKDWSKKRRKKHTKD
jgi:bifunctional UDP-N-acetylglucosamine pyrophosphorylase/glucosamine-1-phosphate N-acetyltransferase